MHNLPIAASHSVHHRLQQGGETRRRDKEERQGGETRRRDKESQQEERDGKKEGKVSLSRHRK